eukprot:g83338.t1
MPGYVATADYYFPPVAGDKPTKRIKILISLWLTCVDTSHPKKDLTVHQVGFLQMHMVPTRQYPTSLPSPHTVSLQTQRVMLSFSYDLSSNSVRMASSACSFLACLFPQQDSNSHNHFAFQSSQLLHEARSKETHKQKCKRINHTQQSQRSFPFPSPTFNSQFNSLPTPPSTAFFLFFREKVWSIFRALAKCRAVPICQHCELHKLTLKKQMAKNMRLVQKHANFFVHPVLKELRKKKLELLRQLAHTKVRSDRKKIVGELKEFNLAFKDKLKELRNERKDEDLRQVVAEMKANPRKAWAILRRLLGKESDSPRQIENDVGEVVGKDAATVFAEQYDKQLNRPSNLPAPYTRLRV